MKPITPDELRHFYDPVKAHQYYIENRKLKGRKKAGKQAVAAVGSIGTAVSAVRGGTAKAAAKGSRNVKEKKFLDKQITTLQQTLGKLHDELKKRMDAAEESEAKSEKSAKEAAKPDTAAEKAESARESKQYRAKNQQKIKAQAEKASASTGSDSSGGKEGKSKAKSADSDSVKDLKATIGKVKVQLAKAVKRRRALG